MTRGFRLQVRESNAQVSLKVRVMYPFPGAITLIEAMFGAPFITHFINTDTFYTIGKTGGQLAQSMKKRFKFAHKKGFGTDVKSFDQSVQPELILMAFAILKFSLTLTPRESQLFDKMVLYFICAPMVSPDMNGKMTSFIKIFGIPSGSFFTNILDTLSQGIAIEFAHPGILDNALLCGDDNLFFPGDGFHFSEFVSILSNEFGLVVSSEKSKFFTSLSSVFYLGFNWLHGIRQVSPLLVINQLLWHDDFITDLSTYDREVSRAASVLFNGANGKHIFAELFPDVMRMLDSNIEVKYSYISSSGPPPTLPVLTGELSVKDSKAQANLSLREHLTNGWFIR